MFSLRQNRLFVTGIKIAIFFFSDDDAGGRPDVVLASVDAAEDPDQLERHRVRQRHEQADRRQLPGMDRFRQVFLPLPSLPTEITILQYFRWFTHDI